MRAALYARYSTDRQRETSIEDQVRGCRERAAREGWEIVAEYTDPEQSGSLPFAARPGAAALLAGALAGQFAVVVTESLQRTFRDLVEQEQIVRRLEFRGLRFVGCSDGYDTLLKARKANRFIRGFVNEIQLDDLRETIHRGLTGQFNRGLFAGGLAYAYRSTEVAGGHRLEIVPDQADTVRRIFTAYAAGHSIGAIVHALNRDRIASPRGSTWAVSALYGSPAKGTGILNNELYRGRYIWNRSQWIKDPDTGRRRRFERPPADWKVSQRDELRIVDDKLWHAVRTRMATPRRLGGAGGRAGGPTTLLGGILRCTCGGAVVAVNAKKYGCAARKDRGPSVCAGLLVDRTRTETAILASVRTELLGPGAVAALQRQVRDLLAERTKGAAAGDKQRQAARAQLERELGNLLDAVAAHGHSAALRARLEQTEAKLATLAAEAPRDPPPATVAAIPNLLAKYRRLLADLPGTLKRDPPRARKIILQLLGQIKLVAENGEIYAEIQTHSGRLLLAAGADAILGRVAGERYPTAIRVRLK